MAVGYTGFCQTCVYDTIGFNGCPSVREAAKRVYLFICGQHRFGYSGVEELSPYTVVPTPGLYLIQTQIFDTPCSVDNMLNVRVG